MHRLLKEDIVSKRELFFLTVTHLWHLRHNNLVPLREFYDGERGWKKEKRCCPMIICPKVAWMIFFMVQEGSI